MVVVPVPVIAPGFMVHVPVAGRPLRTILPVVDVHDDGWVTTPILGADGVPGGEIIITSVEGRDIHPASLVILNLYVPGVRLVMVIPEPVPVMAPGLIVHVPLDGSPFKITLPVADPHDEGCIILPTIGAFGAGGGELTTTSADKSEIQPVELVMLKL
jgi:hypothetical protein